MRGEGESAPALALVSGWASGRADVGERARPEKNIFAVFLNMFLKTVVLTVH